MDHTSGGLTTEAWIAIIVVLAVALLGLITLVVYCLYRQRCDEKKIIYQQQNPNTRNWIETQSAKASSRPQIRTSTGSEVPVQISNPPRQEFIPVPNPPSQAMVPVNNMKQLERLPMDAQISKTTYSNNTEEYGVVIKDINKSTGQANIGQNTQYNQQNAIIRPKSPAMNGAASKQVLNQMQPVNYASTPQMGYQQGREVLLQPNATIVQALPPNFQGTNQFQQPVIKMPAQKSVEPVHYQGAASTTSQQPVTYRSMTLNQNTAQLSYQPIPVPASNQVNYQPQPQSNYQPGNGANPSRFIDPKMTARISNNHGPVSSIQVLQRP